VPFLDLIGNSLGNAAGLCKAAARRGTSEELQAIADEMLRQAYALGGQQVGGAPL